MLDYTKTAVAKIKADFKRLMFVLQVTMQVLGIAYLGYALIAGLGFVWLNIPLLAIAVVALVFLFLDKHKKAKKFVKKMSKYCTRCIKLFSLVLTMYGLYATSSSLQPLDVVLTAMLIVVWLLQVIFDLLSYLIVSRFDMFMAALEADVEEVKRPVEAVGNFFKKMAGKDIAPEKEKSKHRLWLDKKVAETRTQRAERKKEEKQLKKQEKILKKQEKKKNNAK